MVCVFCEIVAGRAPATIVYSDDEVVVLVPPEPKSHAHLVLVSRRHITSADALRPEDAPLWMHLLEVAQRMAREAGINVEDTGYHLGLNAGREGTRKFPHLHLWLLDGARD